MKRFDDPQVNLRTRRSVGVLCGAVVRIELAEYAEPVLRHHLLCSASVVVAEREPGVVCGVGAVVVVCLLVGV